MVLRMDVEQTRRCGTVAHEPMPKRRLAAREAPALLLAVSVFLVSTSGIGSGAMNHLRILWPAPASPALVEDHAPARFSAVLLQGDASEEDLRHQLAGLVLQAKSGRRLPLSLEHLELDVADARIDGLAALRSWRGARLARAHLLSPESLAPRAPRAAAVYDVVGTGEVRRNAVASLRQGGERLALAFASDIHVAATWDTLSSAIDRHAGDLAEDFLHPQRLLREFVRQANALAAAGELDLVVLGGDLVDHVQPEIGRSTPLAQSNVALLRDLIAELEVPAFAVPGNHDFRISPPRLRLPSLASLGIPAARRRSLLRAAGLWDSLPLRVSDARALQSQDERGESALAAHLHLLAPSTDFSVEARGLRLIFASSGRDVLPRWHRVGWRRWPLVARSLPTSWEDPDSEGLDAHQVRRIAGELARGGGSALFMHAPLLHGGPGARAERLGRLDPDDGSELAFERRLQASGLRRGVLFRNPAGLTRALASAGGPLVAFAGHVHHASAIRIDRRTLAVRSSPVAPADPEREIALLTAPSLSHFRFDARQHPGYLYACFERGAAVCLEARTLRPRD